jgi:hypothetical protein
MLDLSDEEREEIPRFIDSLDERVFSAAPKSTWKLRMFYKPSEGISYLVSRDMARTLFYK